MCAGLNIMVDAAFLDPAERAVFHALARKTGCEIRNRGVSGGSGDSDGARGEARPCTPGGLRSARTRATFRAHRRNPLRFGDRHPSENHRKRAAAGHIDGREATAANRNTAAERRGSLLSGEKNIVALLSEERSEGSRPGATSGPPDARSALAQRAGGLRVYPLPPVSDASAIS